MSTAEDMLGVESTTPTTLQEMNATMISDPSVTGDVTQSIAPPSNQAKESARDEGAGHDDSHLLHPIDASSSDPTSVAQQISDNREPSYIRQEATTTQIRQVPENSTIATLKHEHSSRTQSPLRESSVPVPSTEMPGLITTPAPAPPKRSHHKKKGVAAAATTKRSAVGPAKRSHKKKVVASTVATPAQSSPAPRSVRAASSPARSSPDPDGNGDQQFSGEEGEEEEDGGAISDHELYCICKRPDTGTFMIGCDGGCDDWFHGSCVKISEKWKTLIDKYICESCKAKGRGETTWKRMCRRNGCGMPALVSKGTKYCSDRCGLLFMQEMISERTRKSTETTSRAKKGQQTANEDLGARGGIISAGELKALFLTAPTLEGLKSLGDGSLSPITATSPAANTTKKETKETPLSHESALNDIEHERIIQLTHLKSTARDRHALLKDRAKFVAMLKTVASRLADHRNLKPKDLCGFDSRLTWGEDEFDTWRASPAGKEALNIGSLPLPDEDEDADMDASTNATPTQQEPCTKKKCLKHHDWAKLQIEDTRFEITQNADFMRVLEKEEKEIIERARLRAREIKAGGVGGTVEFHYLTPPRESQEDKEMGVEAVVVMQGVEDAGDVDMEGEDVKIETPEDKEVKVEVVDTEEQQNDDEDKEVDMLDAIEASI
ncbi:hypothetical protein E4T42_05234 [Aureobasidium subglaciale]|nr:hypothetical protein E4T42_05234 [Aureobasidium subglaciale]